MKKENCIAMILAGGQGSRLGVLTKNMAKPAMPFGGKYRIIDFTLSNCTNSGINTVGVLTQYSPLALHTAIGIGNTWDLNRKNGGVYLLPPHLKEKGGEWYKGTANAIYQNFNFIRQFKSERVLILSGDHIYKMDYSSMLEFHKTKKADVTIAVISVPWEEASRFGVISTNDEDEIVEFQEKPSNPNSNLASMGIYIFDFKFLEKQLNKDEQNPKSSNDFGKDVIPNIVQEGCKAYAYPFKGYWKDVGTIDSLWEANMDMLDEDSKLDIHDPNWRIYSVNHDVPPNYIAPEAKVTGSIINDGCQIFGEVKNSVLSAGVTVCSGALIENSVIMSGVKVGSKTRIHKAIIGEGASIGTYCQVGNEDGRGEVIVIAEEAEIIDDTILIQQKGEDVKVQQQVGVS